MSTMGDVVSVVLTAVGEIITGLIDIVGDSFTGVVSLWYTAPTGTETNGHLTFLGGLSLLAFGFGVIWLAIRFIGSMISLKQAR